MPHIASCSFGKDSMATIILALEKSELLDGVLYCEVMFTKEISGEIPEHRDFIYNTAIPWIEKQGVPVHVVKTEYTFLDCFFHKLTRSRLPERVGKFSGMPMPGGCMINNYCKVKTIKEYRKKNFAEDMIQYIGIAADEPKRLKRLTGNNISLLDKYGVTEKMAEEICRSHGLLSPIYKFAKRNGCWFCPNSRKIELRHLRETHKELWDLLLWLEKAPNKIERTFNRHEYLWEIEQGFDFDDRQLMID